MNRRTRDSRRYDAHGWPIDPREVGCSPNTPYKDADFELIIRQHVAINYNMQRGKWPQLQFLLLDTTCGPGMYGYTANKNDPDSRITITGTPIRGIEALAESPLVRSQCCFIDIQEDNVLDLKARLAENTYGPPLPRYEAIAGPAEVHAAPWVRQHYSEFDLVHGLVVHDSNTAPNHVLLEQLGQVRQLRQVDFLVYIQAAALKWATTKATGVPDLPGIQRLCRKKIWFIGQVRTNWQSTWFLGTQWPDYDGLKKADLVPLESPEGRSRYAALTMTREELHQYAITHLSGMQTGLWPHIG